MLPLALGRTSSSRHQILGCAIAYATNEANSDKSRCLLSYLVLQHISRSLRSVWILLTEVCMPVVVLKSSKPLVHNCANVDCLAIKFSRNFPFERLLISFRWLTFVFDCGLLRFLLEILNNWCFPF